ncbi:MAG: hypothetical protein ABI868_21650 [Acidobacteriota bacterium]
MVGLFAVFACFQWVATALGSDRGQAGLTVGGLVVAATLASERRWFARTVKVLVVSNDSAAPFPLVWMGVAAVLPMLVFLIPRPGSFTPRSV